MDDIATSKNLYLPVAHCWSYRQWSDALNLPVFQQVQENCFSVHLSWVLSQMVETHVNLTFNALTGKKTAYKNIEVTMHVLSDDGTTLEVITHQYQRLYSSWNINLKNKHLKNVQALYNLVSMFLL